MRRDLGDGFELDDDPARIDVGVVHRFISEESYWGRGRTRERMEELLARAGRVVGLYGPDGRLIGFSRTVPCDDASLVYLADVFVLPEARGRGLGVELVHETVERGPYAGRRWILHTDDAHELYARFGFAASERLLERPADRA